MKKNLLATAGVLTAGLVIGGAFAISGANAADSTAATTASTASTDVSAATAHDSTKPDETLVTGDALTKLTDAAMTKYPGATVIRVENDSDGAVYEVHLKLADGSVKTVEFDANFAVTGDHDGFGKAGDGHGPRGDHDGDHGPRDAADNDGDGPEGAGWTAPTTGTTQSN